ncbi:MAG: HNH endonuclease, partial [Marmoricola sp.]|nr:HNH endonuclease [Marmoricola sp.]
MTSTLQPTAPAPLAGLGACDSAGDVLAFARARKQAAQQAEADVLAAAVAWAEMHPPESIGDASYWVVGDHGIDLAGEGAPQIAELAVPELAAALGLATDSGKHLIGQALELAWRLPRHWARVQAGDLAPWRARRLAEQTMTLTQEAAAWVDVQLAPYLHKTSFAAQERLVAEAVARFDPARAQAEADAAEDRRHVKVAHEHVSFWGTSRVEGELDLADALDLEAAIQAGAERLAALGSTETLDVRRSQALGALARGELALEAPCDTDADAVEAASRRMPGRSVVLYVHLSEAALRSRTEDCLDLARVENARQVVTADQIREWCGRPGASVTVKPVIDLDDHLHVEQYEVPDRLAERSALR